MKAEYVNHMGDDLMVVNSARVSFDKESEMLYYVPFEDTYYDKANLPPHVRPDVECQEVLSTKDAGLISYLSRNGHWTPFAHPQITIRETVPIFVARQRFKHMIGFVYNEVSRRYVDDTPEFFIPDYWRARPDANIKQGSGGEHPYSAEWDLEHGSFVRRAKELYQEMIDNDIAPEQARMVLPQSMYTSYYVTGSLAAWARAYRQRIDPHAQKEIQDLAVQWGKILEPLFPVSWTALTS